MSGLLYFISKLLQQMAGSPGAGNATPTTLLARELLVLDGLALSRPDARHAAARHLHRF